MQVLVTFALAALVVFAFFALQSVITLVCAIIAFVGRSAYLGLELGWFLGEQFWRWKD